MPRKYKGHSWTKHSGGRALPQDSKVWYCQRCGSKQEKELRTFLFELFPNSNEYIQLCVDCAPELVVVEKVSITTAEYTVHGEEEI